MKIGFIGAGNMGGAIFRSFIEKNVLEAKDIYIYRIHREKLKADVLVYGVNCCESYEELIKKSDWVVLAVKPNVLRNILPEISKYFKDHIVISIAAGVEIRQLEELIGKKISLMRIMPNINAEVAMSASAYCCNDVITDEQKKSVLGAFEKIGRTFEMEEDKFAIFSAIAGCSPAYIYLFADSLAKGAQKLGMDKKRALEIVSYTMMGSAKMLLNSSNHPCELIDRVCSPGGTTIEGLCTLEDYGFQSALVKAVKASVKKDRKLGNK